VTFFCTVYKRIFHNCLVLHVRQDLKESFNYGLYCPPVGGKAGKFLDEERPLKDYPLPGPVGFLEVSYRWTLLGLYYLEFSA